MCGVVAVAVTVSLCVCFRVHHGGGRVRRGGRGGDGPDLCHVANGAGDARHPAPGVLQVPHGRAGQTGHQLYRRWVQRSELISWQRVQSYRWVPTASAAQRRLLSAELMLVQLLVLVQPLVEQGASARLSAARIV